MGAFEDLINSRIDALGLKKTDLAKKIGYSESYTTNITNGKAVSKNGTVRFHPDVLNKMATFIEVPIEVLLTHLGFKLSPRREHISYELTNFIVKVETLEPETQSKFLHSMSILIDILKEKESSDGSLPQEKTGKALINGQEVEIKFL